MDKKTFRKLQLKWYGKLRRSGFRDIEGNSDFNCFPVSTLRSSPGGTCHLPWDFSDDDAQGETHLHGWDGQSGLGEAANWEYYQRIRDYAESLDREDKTRHVLLCFLDKHPRYARKMTKGVSPRRAMSIWNETIRQLGLPPESGYYPKRGQESPAPVRRLSKSEIRRLKLTAPRQIKDKS